MIISIIEAQRAYFRSGATLDICFRRQMLKKLQAALVKWEKPLTEALWTDLHKSYQEAYLTELSRIEDYFSCRYWRDLAGKTSCDNYPRSQGFRAFNVKSIWP